jgi:2-polyprenyl-3-methyl-5-hydroxy-6-metoxy-1,4-benzoquinol methylase
MENSTQHSEWFEEWFDTHYYHILYKNRNHAEAETFVLNLVQHLQMKPEHEVLDLACGKGRHSIFLNKLGLHVTGADLSCNSIAEASQSENSDLHFVVHDMREVLEGHQFDFIVNLFTSFGYFDNQSDNLRVLQSIRQMLAPGGKLVIDFMNSQYVTQNMVVHETKEVEGLVFHLERSTDGAHIYKQIQFEDGGQQHCYKEKVQALTLSDFQKLLEKTGFTLLETFGDFQLNPFNANTSERLILIAE